MGKNRTETFQGYCPTQDKWERVERTFLDVSTMGSSYPKYIKGMLLCPYISFRNKSCDYADNCPVESGEWSTESADVFVALQFKTPSPDNKERTIVENVIKPVCNELGLKAFVINEKQYNSGIYEEILKSISRNRFIIADLTYANNGAYYEAGFAKGQGKQVIHACEKNWFENNKVHFDVQGLNLIIYENETDFGVKLKERIRSTIAS
jgi:nucleoside 2-deoxyribosyltransferase